MCSKGLLKSEPFSFTSKRQKTAVPAPLAYMAWMPQKKEITSLEGLLAIVDNEKHVIEITPKDKNGIYNINVVDAF